MRWSGPALQAAVIGLVALVIVAGLPFVAEAVEWVPGAKRQIAPDATSRGRAFRVDVAFTAPDPATTSVFVSDGRDGDKWFIPHDYVRFKVVGFVGTPAASHYNGRSSWIWEPAAYAAGQTIKLTYDVKVATTVLDGVYPIEGVVGTGDGRSSLITGLASVGVRPVQIAPSTSRPSYQRTETTEVVAVVTYPDGTAVSAATASAVINRTGQTLTLSAGTPPGRYAGTFVLKPNDVVGAWRATITADDGSNNANTVTVDFAVSEAILRVDVATDKSTYFGGQPVAVTATVVFPVGLPVDNAVASALFQPAGDRMGLTKGTAPGGYTGTYTLKSDAAVGTWSAVVEAADPHGNKGTGRAPFEVGFTILLVAPSSAKSAYHSLESVQLTAQVQKPDRSAMSGASVQAVFNRTGDTIVLAEVSPGNYAGAYRIPRGAATGAWQATVTARFGDASGQGIVTFGIVPAVLNVGVTTDKAAYARTESAKVRAEIRSPDGTPLSGASVTATSDRVQRTVTLAETAPGVYEAVMPLRVDDPIGAWIVTVTAMFDSSGGSGTSPFELKPATLAVSLSTDKAGYLQTETVLFTARVAYPDGQAVLGGTVAVRLDRTPDSVTLQDRGGGVYTGTFKLARDAAIGTWAASVAASDAFANAGSSSGTFEARLGTLSARVVTDLSYQISESVRIRASATYPDGSPFTGATGTATFAPGGAQVPLQEVGNTGEYAADYRVAPGAPFGAWTAAIELVDGPGNRATGTSAFTVEKAELRVALSLSSPTLKRLDTLQLSARVQYPDGTDVPNAEVFALLAPGDLRVTLAASGNVYAGSVRFAVDAQRGPWTATAKADHRDGIGESMETFGVSPTSLTVAVTTSDLAYTQGGSAVVEARVTYADGASVPQATVRVTISDGVQDIVTDAQMTAGSGGTFTFTFSLSEEARTGRWRASVKAADAYGNEGTESAEFQVNVRPPFLTLTSLLIIVVVAVVAAVVAFGLARRRTGRRKE